MAKLVLVKHAAPEIRPDIASDRWVLSQAGRETCSRLASRLRERGVRRLYASLEPKALETAALAALELDLELRPRRDLHENDRAGLGFGSSEEFERRIRRFFQEPDQLVIGRETASAALSRFEAAIDAIAAEAPGEPAAVVTHGTVLTLLVAARNPVDPFDLWRRLGLASCLTLDWPEGTWDGVVHRLED